MSQFVISNSIFENLKKLPDVFTEPGVAMLSSVLNSEIAIEVNIQIIGIFAHVREILTDHIEGQLIQIFKTAKMLISRGSHNR